MHVCIGDSGPTAVQADTQGPASGAGHLGKCAFDLTASHCEQDDCESGMYARESGLLESLLGFKPDADATSSTALAVHATLP